VRLSLSKHVNAAGEKRVSVSDEGQEAETIFHLVERGTDMSLLNDEFIQMALPSIRSDYRAIETYLSDSERTVSCPITVMTGDADPKTTVEEAEAWSEHTTGSFRVDVYKGGHFFIVEHQVAVNDEVEQQLKQLSALG